MDALEKETKYISKLENDASERMYDLLVRHLENLYDKIPKESQNVKKLISILDKAIRDMRIHKNRYNEEQYNRYILITCNKILRYDTSRTDLKDLKMMIIDEFTNSEHEFMKKIPINYQINELRITHDTTYAFYLIDKLIKDKNWTGALYFLIACRLLEPDDERIESYDKIIRENLKEENIFKEPAKKDDDLTIFLDSNIIIQKLKNIIKSYLPSPAYSPKINLNSLGTQTIRITNSVKQEIKKFIDAELDHIKKELHGKDFGNLKRRLYETFKEFINKYYYDNEEISALNVQKVKEFYAKYPLSLEQVTLNKLKHNSLSKKLRKLAQRPFLLPEEGDVNLIAEVMSLSEKENCAIMTMDSDFISFSGNLKRELGVKILPIDAI